MSLILCPKFYLALYFVTLFVAWEEDYALIHSFMIKSGHLKTFTALKLYKRN